MEPNRQGEVWVFAEQEDHSLHDVVLELCGKARQLAGEHNLNVARISGSGPKGAVLADDVLAAIDAQAVAETEAETPIQQPTAVSQPVQPEFQPAPTPPTSTQSLSVSRMWQVMAQRLSQS